ncbi:hypothetical protein VOLCADRAFT_106376 [Volvox carteri f. nagariensis]|uniref:Enoyl reductase (ER) domain-containing protein n=1 Tax=Volvox carteri f. nagariensis TaxID=3068 RepID=D8U708_VOLCA|nr:uncharacterized protein VOLCADRAFT_106376 [Volvox carteri f. nagariensis]EFJ44532.1 hypothetical protein VOLCADRAFT_106376 [Volvox carteri f. nagariensis]|eukprot:XP_002954382.1 hypothetical protein VOLCADRAFT_106376 [Volvox carteri f. nagariensis]
MASIPETQTAIQLSAFGIDNITVGQLPVPSPGAGEVLVRITARPVNPSDVFSVIGVYPGYKPKDFPAVPGLEGAGEVAALGPNVSGRLSVGQRVVATQWRGAVEGRGTWQQYVLAAEEDLVPVPDDLPDDAACQALINPVPVIGMMEELAVPEGEVVIFTAAGSALGRMFLRYASTRGVKVVATCRREEQVEELKQAGAYDAVVLGADADALVARVSELTGGRGAWGALDSIAGSTPAKIAPAVREGGTIIVYGAMSGPNVDWNVGQCLFRGVALKGFWLVPWLAAKPAEEQRRVLTDVLEHMRSGLLPPMKTDVRPLEEAAAALRDQAIEGRPAKIVLRG